MRLSWYGSSLFVLFLHSHRLWRNTQLTESMSTLSTRLWSLLTESKRSMWVFRCVCMWKRRKKVWCISVFEICLCAECHGLFSLTRLWIIFHLKARWAWRALSTSSVCWKITEQTPTTSQIIHTTSILADGWGAFTVTLHLIYEGLVWKSTLAILYTDRGWTAWTDPLPQCEEQALHRKHQYGCRALIHYGQPR